VVPLAVVVALAAMTAGCADPEPGTRVEPALSLVLDEAPRPEDREVRIRVGMSALAQGIDRVEVRREGDRIGVEVWVRNRVPGADEAVSNSARTEVRVVPLDELVGTANVVDLLASPPTALPEA
jgi:hypothetical protein